MSEPEVDRSGPDAVKTSSPGGSFSRWQSDWGFLVALILIGSFYVIMLLAMLAADLTWTSPGHFLEALSSDEIQYSIRLSLMSCTLAAILSDQNADLGWERPPKCAVDSEENRVDHLP